MPLRQITVPWMRGYDIGLGADYCSLSPLNLAVRGDITPTYGAGGAISEFTVKRVVSTSDLETELGIAAEVNCGLACFCAGGGARFEFAKRTKIQSSSLFMLVKAGVEMAFQQIDRVELTPEAAAVIGNQAAFTQRFGNMFVRGITTGGLYLATLRIDATSTSECEQIATALNGAYKCFSAEAEAKFREVQNQYQGRVQVSVWQEGGPISDKPIKFDDPMALLQGVNGFLESFEKRPNEVARPYSVTLAPLSMALGPLPPDEAQIEHAQGVILFCARQRSRTLDQLNLLEYVISQPGRFDFTNSVSLDVLREASQHAQDDLDLLAGCASRAMADVRNAVMPNEFSRITQRAYPLLKMPSPLPPGIPSAPPKPPRSVLQQQLEKGLEMRFGRLSR